MTVEYSDQRPTSPRPTPSPTPTPGTKPVPPVTFSALDDYSVAVEKSPHVNEGNCYRMDGRKDGVDAKYTSDQVCIHRDDARCFVGWTERGGK